MKVRITKPRVFVKQTSGAEEELAVGTEITIKGDDIPASLLGKCEVVAEKPKKISVTNPKKKAD